MRLAETRYGASFYILFGPAIQLGVISRRKAYTETIQYEKDRNAGFLSPFGYSTPTVTSAVDAICSMEVFYFITFLSCSQYHTFSSSSGLICYANQASLSFASNNLYVYMIVVLALGIKIPSMHRGEIFYKNLEMEGLSCTGFLLTF